MISALPGCRINSVLVAAELCLTAFKQYGELCQVRSGPGLVQVWFRLQLQLKFISLELDSEVGRLVSLFILTTIKMNNNDHYLTLTIIGKVV